MRSLWVLLPLTAVAIALGTSCDPPGDIRKVYKIQKWTLNTAGCDTEGADTLRRSLVDWLDDMELVPAGGAANFDRYIGYYEPYATSHDALDRDTALFEEVRNAARSLVNTVRMIRGGRREPDADLQPPRPK